MGHVRLCRAATKSGDKDWYKKIDEKVIEDCMQLGACCPVNWLTCLSTLARLVESVSVREEEETASGRDRRVTAACWPFGGNTSATESVPKGVGPGARAAWLRVEGLGSALKR